MDYRVEIDEEIIERIEQNDDDVTEVELCGLDDDEMDLFVTAMEENTVVCAISLKDCIVTRHIMGSLLDLLEREPRAINRLHFDSSSFETGESSSSNVSLLPPLFRSLLAPTSTVKSFSLFACEAPVPADDLANVVLHNKILTHLELECWLINDAIVKRVADALMANETLQKLSLRGNEFADEGAKALARLLEVNTSLQELHIQDNCIGNNGIAAIVQALEVNTTLLSLSLHENETLQNPAYSGRREIAGNEGLNFGAIEAIGNSLARMKGLRSLCIFTFEAWVWLPDFNYTPPEYVSPIVAGLQSNMVLEELDYKEIIALDGTGARNFREQLKYYLGSLHKRILRDRSKTTRIPLSLWPALLCRVLDESEDNAGVLYYYLRSDVDLFFARNKPLRRSEKKRKRRDASFSHQGQVIGG